jgi:hypothetical protein
MSCLSPNIFIGMEGFVMKRKGWILFVGLLVLVLGLLGCTTTGVSEEEKEFLITVDDLATQGVHVGTPTQEGEKYTARRFANGTTEVEYEYDSENDPANQTIVLFYSEADTHRDETVSIKSFEDAVEAYKLGAAWGNNDIDVVGGFDHLDLGDQNYSAYLELDGNRFGNLVVVRKGRLVYSFLLAGPYIKYAEPLYSLIRPKLLLVSQ